MTHPKPDLAALRAAYSDAMECGPGSLAELAFNELLIANRKALIELAEKAEAAIAERGEQWSKRRAAEGDRDSANAVSKTLRYERDALKAGLDAIKSAITDPENQPSQYGTVTLAWHEAEMAGARARIGELEEGLRPFATFGVDENGNDLGLMKDRICDWFGPGDFEHARRAARLTPAEAGGVILPPQ